MSGDPAETWLITGANRGIGLALARAHLARGGRVIATHRREAPGPGLDALSEDSDRLSLLRWDLREPPDPARLAPLPDRIDVICANAGIFGPRDPSAFGLDQAGLREAFEVNALGTLRTVETFLPRLRTAPRPRIVALTSLMGTASRAGRGSLGYRMSKAAMNMAMQVMAAELAPEGIALACLRPGHVRTRMGGETGALSPAQSAAALLALVDGLQPGPGARLLDIDGTPLPW